MNGNDYETGLNRDERFFLNKIRMKQIEVIEKNNQPERSKREESPKLVYIEPNPKTMSDAMKVKYEKAKAICGTLNTMETS